jgi:hypothetical protein
MMMLRLTVHVGFSHEADNVEFFTRQIIGNEANNKILTTYDAHGQFELLRTNYYGLRYVAYIEYTVSQ